MSPNALTRSLLAEVLRTRLAIRVSGTGASLADLPDKSKSRLVIADESDMPAEGAVPTTRLLPIAGNTSIDEIIETIRKELRIAPTSLEQLTPLETEVLRAVAAGQRSAEIARRQRRSVKTVEKHRANVHRKLGVRTVAQLTAYAIRAGLLDLDAVLSPRKSL